MAGDVVLFGATGYTGRLTAEALLARGDRPVLAARNEGRLKELAAELGGELETRVADVDRPQSVRDLVGPGDVMLATVGPFARWGDPAAEAAIAAGCAYLDSTGEPPFIRRVFEHHGPRAAASGAALITAFGYDWVPGNLAAGLALADAGPDARRVEVGYFATGGLGGMSGGTRASLAGAMVEPSFAWRSGALHAERGAARVRRFHAAGKDRPAISVGSSEHFAVPAAHPGIEEVDVYLGWFGGASRAMQAFSLVNAGLIKVPGVKAGVGALTGRVKGSTGGPGPQERAGTGSAVVAIARDAEGGELARVELRGINGYDFTGRILAWGAATALAGGISGAGALGPEQAFGLSELEAGCAEAGLERV